jgi:uncharacterized glyoxalase superfamily protein PhnB
VSKQTFEAAIFYKEPKNALAWLARAFGFKLTLLIEGPGGDESQLHAEMRFGEGQISVGGEWSDRTRSPASLGANTQTLEARLETDVDAHCEQARSAGATIVQEPRDEPWDDRRYRCLDLEGHLWSFAQPRREVSLDDLRAMGLKIQSWEDPT